MGKTITYKLKDGLKWSDGRPHLRRRQVHVASVDDARRGRGLDDRLCDIESVECPIQHRRRQVQRISTRRYLSMFNEILPKHYAAIPRT